MGGALLKSLTFGVVIAASIGPIALLIIRTAANRGLRQGCYAGLGAALADLIYALPAFILGALLLPWLRPWMTAIRVGSALVLIAVAIALVWRDSTADGGQDHPGAQRLPAGSLLPTFLLTLVNPMTLVMYAGFVPQLPLAGSLWTAAVLAVGLFVGSLVVQLALAAAGAFLGAALRGGRWRRAVNLAGAAGILAFGVAGLLAAA